MPIYITKLPFPIKIEAGETSEFYFTDRVIQFNIKFENFNPNLKVQLSSITGDKEEYLIKKNNELISKGFYSIVRFTNTDNSIIEIVLNS